MVTVECGFCPEGTQVEATQLFAHMEGHPGVTVSANWRGGKENYFAVCEIAAREIGPTGLEWTIRVHCTGDEAQVQEIIESAITRLIKDLHGFDPAISTQKPVPA